MPRFSNWCLLVAWVCFLTLCVEGLTGANISWVLWYVALAAGVFGFMVEMFQSTMTMIQEIL